MIRTFDTKGKTSHMVTLGPGARWAYVSNSSSATVSAVNLETGEVRSIACGERPEGSVLSKDGRFVYVANREGRSITIIDTGTNQAAGASRPEAARYGSAGRRMVPCWSMQRCTTKRWRSPTQWVER